MTFYDTGLLRMTPTIAMMSEFVTYGRPANVGPANRTQAVWDGDTLMSDSHLGRLPVARREVGADGAARLVFIDLDLREHDLARFEREHCVDEDTRDVLCARLIVPGGSAPAERGACREPRDHSSAAASSAGGATSSSGGRTIGVGRPRTQRASQRRSASIAR